MTLRINSNVCVFVVLVIGICVQTSSALKCWQCTSYTDKDACSDPFNGTEYNTFNKARDCDEGMSPNSYTTRTKYVCKKTVQKEHGQTKIIRQCAIPSDEELDITNGPCGPHTVTQSHVTVQSCHICDTDYCNGASSISGMQFLQACIVAAVTCVLSPSIRSFF